MPRNLSGPGDRIADRIRGAALRLLLETRDAVSQAQLVREVDVPEGDVHQLIRMLDGQGRMRLNGDGDIIGAGGLSVVPDRHEIHLAGHRLWTWCAYDILGLFGALHADGRARSTIPGEPGPVAVAFREGRPERVDLVVFLPDAIEFARCKSVYDQICPNSNFFRNAVAAQAWAMTHRVTGTALPLDNAADRATVRWQPLLAAGS